MAITPQLAEKSREMIEKKHLGFEMLRDEGNRVAEEYGLRWKLSDELKAVYLSFGLDLPATNGEDSWTLPMPARYLIDSSGVVRWGDVNADYTRRPEPAATLDALSRLRAD